MPLSFDDLVPAGNGNAGAAAPAERKAVSFDDLVPAAQAAPADTFKRFTFLPVGKDMKTGEYSPALPKVITGIPDMLEGMYEGAKQAVTAPMRAYTGELQLTGPDGKPSPEAIGESLNFALFGSPASRAGNLFAGAPAAAAAVPKAIVPQVLKPGQEAALAADRLGVDLPRAAASDLTGVQQTGKILTNVPIGGTPLRDASTKAIKQLDDAALKAQRGYGAGDVAGAGASVRQGVQDYSANTLDDLVSKKYDVVDNLVKPDVQAPLSATAKAVADIRARRGAAALPQDGVSTSIVSDAIERTGLTYQGIKDLRSTIGGYIKKPQLAPAGADQGELKAIYASLSDDLRGVVKAAGGDKAVSAFEEANSFAAKTAAEQKALDKIIGPQSDEGLFSKIQSMAGSTSTADIQSLMRVRKAVSPETWNEMSSAVISKMGRDADGAFSPDRFLTAYGKLSTNGKNLLFKTSGKDDLAASLDDIATVSRRFKQLDEFSNPSGTGRTAAGIGYLSGLFLEPTTVVGSLVGTRALSTVMAKPTSAKALAKWSQAYEEAATKPSKAASIALGARGRVLALAIANENGAPEAYNQISTALSRLSYVKAKPGDEQRGNEDQHERERQQLRALDFMDPNKT